ncbi:hypothetical protein Dimus_005831, partial [Dionaea muscipula]
MTSADKIIGLVDAGKLTELFQIGVKAYKSKAAKGKAVTEDPKDPDDDDKDDDDDDDDDNVPLSHRKRKSTAQVVIESDSIGTAQSIHSLAHESSPHDSAAQVDDQDQDHEESPHQEEHESEEQHMEATEMEEESKDEDVETKNPKDDVSGEASRDGVNVDDEATDPQDDTCAEASRDDEAIDDVVVDPKDDVIEEVLRDIAAGKGLEMVVYQGDPTAPAQPIRSNIHEHIEKVVRCILEGMDQQSRGITELSEHMESKIFTNNQKENIMHLKLDEIKIHIRNILITITKTLKSVADIVSSK